MRTDFFDSVIEEIPIIEKNLTTSEIGYLFPHIVEEYGENTPLRLTIGIYKNESINTKMSRGILTTFAEADFKLEVIGETENGTMAINIL